MRVKESCHATGVQTRQIDRGDEVAQAGEHNRSAECVQSAAVKERRIEAPAVRCCLGGNRDAGFDEHKRNTGQDAVSDCLRKTGCSSNECALYASGAHTKEMSAAR